MAKAPGMKVLLQLQKDRLEDQMFRLMAQSEAIRNKLTGIDIAISILEKGDQAPVGDGQVSKTNLKVLLLELARDAGTTGINSNTAVQKASKRGIKILRGSAASNLSRLKNDGALIQDGTVYRLPEFVRQQPQLILGGKGT
jgi:hypothetical protein